MPCRDPDIIRVGNPPCTYMRIHPIDFMIYKISFSEESWGCMHIKLGSTCRRLRQWITKLSTFSISSRDRKGTHQMTTSTIKSSTPPPSNFCNVSSNSSTFNVRTEGIKVATEWPARRRKSNLDRFDRLTNVITSSMVGSQSNLDQFFGLTSVITLWKIVGSQSNLDHLGSQL